MWDGGWHMGWMWIVWLLFLAALFFLVWGAVTGARGGAPRESPEDILKKRYARGEIDREDYERRLEDLRR